VGADLRHDAGGPGPADQCPVHEYSGRHRSQPDVQRVARGPHGARLVRSLLRAALRADRQRAGLRFGARRWQLPVRHRSVHARRHHPAAGVRRHRSARPGRDPRRRLQQHRRRSVPAALQASRGRAAPLPRDPRQRAAVGHQATGRARSVHGARLEPRQPARRTRAGQAGGRLPDHLLRRLPGGGRVAGGVAADAAAAPRPPGAVRDRDRSHLGALRPVLGRADRSGRDPQLPALGVLQLGESAGVRDHAGRRFGGLQEHPRPGAGGAAGRAAAVLRERLRVVPAAPVRHRRLDAQRGRPGDGDPGLPRRAHPGGRRTGCVELRARQAAGLRARRTARRVAQPRPADGRPPISTA
jgi:hypothetical protein